MSVTGLLAGTATLWLLKAFVVMPLAQYLTRRQVRQVAYAAVGSGHAGEVGEAPADLVDPSNCVFADVLVLGAAGLIAGLLGYLLIGIASKGREWPGLITCVVASLVGITLR